MDLLSNYGTISSQIDTLWNIFMLVHVTLFAGLWKLGNEVAKAKANPKTRHAIKEIEWIRLPGGQSVFSSREKNSSGLRSSLGVVEWIGLFAGYTVFAFLNWNALRGDYNILDHISQDISRFSGEELRKAANTVSAIRKQRPQHRDSVVAIVHIGAAFFIVAYSYYLGSDKKLPVTWARVKQIFRRR